VERALKKKDASLLVFEAPQVVERVQKMGDLFEPVLTLKQKLPRLPGIEEAQASTIESGLEIAAQADGASRSKSASPSGRRSKAKRKGRRV